MCSTFMRFSLESCRNGPVRRMPVQSADQFAYGADFPDG